MFNWFRLTHKNRVDFRLDKIVIFQNELFSYFNDSSSCCYQESILGKLTRVWFSLSNRLRIFKIPQTYTVSAWGITLENIVASLFAILVQNQVVILFTQTNAFAYLIELANSCMHFQLLTASIAACVGSVEKLKQKG